MTKSPILLIAVIGTAILALFLWFENSTSAQTEFQKRCPKPAWWTRAESHYTPLKSVEHIRNWSRSARGPDDRDIYTLMYVTLNNTQDPHVAVAAAQEIANRTMNNPQTLAENLPILEYAVEHYFNYENKIEGPGWGKADAVGWIVGELIVSYNNLDRPRDAINLAKRFLSERGKDANQHTLELISLDYADALVMNGQRAEAEKVLTDAIQNYNGDWEPKLKTALDRYQNGSGAITSDGLSVMNVIARQEARAAIALQPASPVPAAPLPQISGTAVTYVTPPVSTQMASSAFGLLGSLRSSLSIFYADTSGKFPATLLALPPKYIQGIPTLDLPDHDPSNRVHIYRGALQGQNAPSAPRDTGGWGYDPDNGHVFIDCTHEVAQSNGKRWSVW